MRACKHFSSPLGDETDIDASERYPWNAWVTVWQGWTRVNDKFFRTGLMWDYLKHLENSPQCREELGVDIETIQRKLRFIEEEWEAVTN
jgi:hypothetical protein